MKAHASEAMPIAFLAMHEEKSETNAEVTAVWEEVRGLFKNYITLRGGRGFAYALRQYIRAIWKRGGGLILSKKELRNL